MTKIVQLHRGTTATEDAYTGSVGEVTVDTDRNELRLQDGSTAGGNRILNKTQNDTAYQAKQANLTAIAGQTTAADKLTYWTGSGAAGLADFTATARTLVDDTSVGAMRTTLGVAIGSNVQAWDADLDTLAALGNWKLAYTNGSSAQVALALGAANTVLQGNGTGAAPTFSYITEAFMVALGDETTAVTTGTAVVTMRIPYAFTITDVRANVNTVSSSGLPTVDIKKNGTTIFSTKLTIDASEFTSVTAATPYVLSTTALADDDSLTFNIDVAGTGTKGLKVAIIGHKP